MLGDILPQVLFGFALVMTRIAALIMVAPVLGETVIPTRVRFGLTFIIALVVYPMLSAGLPAIPETPLALFLALFVEILIGVFIGGAARLVMSGLHMAGTIIAFQGGLSVAQGFDPTQGTQSAVISTFLTILATVLIFAADLHHLMLMAIINSFNQFPAGQIPSIANFAELAVDILADSFVLAMQISAPFLVYGLVFYIGLGLLARLMPQLQVFFIAMPLNIVLSFLILILVLTVAMSWFLTHFENVLLIFTQ